MNLKEFISNNDVEKSLKLIDTQTLENAEALVGVKFGEELTEYVLKYGYLAFDYIEFYGINAKQGLNSDMVKQTLYLHNYFPATNPFIAIENQGDGDYYLVNEEDEVYEYVSEQDELIKTGLTLFEYILKRLKEI